VYIGMDLCATLLSTLSLVALATCCDNKPVVLATWAYVNATKTGLYDSVAKVEHSKGYNLGWK